MSDRSNFRFRNDQVFWFFTIDRPIHNEQLHRFEQEFGDRIDEILSKPRTKAARLTRKWVQQFRVVQNDGYGSFRLEFESELENYTDAELASFHEDISEICCELPIVESIRIMDGIEEDLDDYIECHGAEDAMTFYIDAVLESGYRLAQSDVEEMFMPHITAQAIANDFLMRKLKGQNVVCKEIKQELAVA